jgi:hypothetical protein
MSKCHCGKRACFNIFGEVKGKFCSEHKEPEMINVLNKSCDYPCEHGVRKYSCVTCKGNQICEHERIKYTCKECKGSQICSHGKKKSICIECDGKSLCEHKKLKSICVDCKGISICMHGKRKTTCLDCGGTDLCTHQKRKATCKECKGISICLHGIHKRGCKDCKGSLICSHNKDKRYCKECKGSAICIHNKSKRYCKECKGSALCKHDKEKRYCKECGGKGLCEHNIMKKICKTCDGRELCTSDFCENRKNNKCNGYCRNCFIHLFPNETISKNYKTKEKCVIDHISNLFPNETWRFDRHIIDGCSKRRPDALLDLGSHLVIIEVDENKHSNYDCSCENKRLMLLSQDVGHRPIVFIRFNPDGYKDESGNHTSCWTINKVTSGILYVPAKKKKEWEHRLKVLNNQIDYWKENKPCKTIEMIELFY